MALSSNGTDSPQVLNSSLVKIGLHFLEREILTSRLLFPVLSPLTHTNRHTHTQLFLRSANLRNDQTAKFIRLRPISALILEF